MLYKLYLVIKTIKNFPVALFDKLGFIHGFIIYKIRGTPLEISARGGTEDMAEIVVVLSGDEYDLKKIVLPKNPTIFDLGAHIGTFSIYISHKLKNKCKIFAYEPDNENFKLAQKNLQVNKVKNINLQRLAISDYKGKGFLEKRNLNTDAYHLEFSKKSKLEKNCDVSTIIAEVKKERIKKIDILKMDIEGGEYSIFLHKPSLMYIKKNVHFIFIEVHNINKNLNYSKIEKIIEDNFKIIGKKKSVLTLENLKLKEGNKV